MTSFDAGRVRVRVEPITGHAAASIIIVGEADVGTLEQFRGAFAGIELNGAKTVQLDVADLTFCDIAAMRELTHFARQLSAAGRNVETRGARSTLHKMARLMNVDGDLGLP
ncbi:MAG: STAS domain-containing protein [Mycobacteriaceae bacterium]